MLGPVKFNPAGNPRPGQPHKRRFDHMIIVYKIIIVGFVIGPLNPSAQLRKHHYLQIFIFQINGLVCFIHLPVYEFFHSRIRIYSAAATLINAFFQKNRDFFRLPRFISGNHNLLTPHFYFIHHNNLPFSQYHFLTFRVLPSCPVRIHFFFIQITLFREKIH